MIQQALCGQLEDSTDKTIRNPLFVFSTIQIWRNLLIELAQPNVKHVTNFVGVRTHENVSVQARRFLLLTIEPEIRFILSTSVLCWTC